MIRTRLEEEKADLYRSLRHVFGDSNHLGVRALADQIERFVDAKVEDTINKRAEAVLRTRGRGKNHGDRA